MGKEFVFLLVEPSPLLRSSLRDWLVKILADHRFLTASNGAEALTYAKEERPSHILMEMELPERTGVEVLREIRQILPDSKIIATGWYDNSFLLKTILSAGADGFIRKQRLPRELLPLWGVPLK